jgi:hypothetical protein
MHALSHETLLFLIAHILGDYHLQSEERGERKNSPVERLRYVGIHLMLMFPISLWMHVKGYPVQGWLLWILLGASHYLFDALISQLRKSKSDETLYLLDQVAHVALVVLLCELLFHTPLQSPLSSEQLRWILLFVLITKPANVTFKKLFRRYQLVPRSANPIHVRETVETEPGAGALIGNLERVLSAIFLSVGQYGAIGLIYTAKSIARFKQIEENRRFAEYYLIGTLYSILYVVLAYFILIVGVI